MILDEDLILEIVRPGTGEPVPDGEVGEIALVEPGSLPNDGKVIEDARKYE
jgi:phenylacetate-coenzyme A ligase PaaK-like adenylate-forming protein